MDETITPRCRAQHERFLQAAMSVFLEQGFEKASMAEIVKRSGGSLSTVYKLFGNKEGLFSAALKLMTDQFAAEFEELARSKSEAPIEEFLHAFGIKVLETVVSDVSILMVRMATAEGHKNGGELGRIFFSHGFSQVLSVLARQLKLRQEKGLLRPADPELAAIRFFQMVKEPYHFRMLVTGERPELSTAQRNAIVSEAVEFFLHGILKR
ncbi:MAG: TetR/AcrR family transcriptional regulator [Campylobacterales bacterium]